MGREAFYLRDKGQKVKSDCVSSKLYQNLNFNSGLGAKPFPQQGGMSYDVTEHFQREFI